MGGCAASERRTGAPARSAPVRACRTVPVGETTADTESVSPFFGLRIGEEMVGERSGLQVCQHPPPRLVDRTRFGSLRGGVNYAAALASTEKAPARLRAA
jgi:hypothetical protein